MTRKLILAVTVLVALLFGLFAQNAEANNSPCHIDEPVVEVEEPNDNGPFAVVVAAEPIGHHVGHADCADAEKYPGFFTNHPAAPIGPYGMAALNITAAAPAVAAAGTGGGDSAAPLAATGTDSQVLAYLGTGLIAFGAMAMGSRRRFLQNALD